MPRVVSEEKKAGVVKTYKEKPITISALAKQFNLSSPTIMKILNDNGIKRYTKTQLYNPNMNEDYFETIDNQTNAYFLGLIIADGNVFKDDYSNRQASISITLEDSDIYMLQKFKDEIRVETSINSDGRGSSMIAVRSNKMANDLSKYGVVPRKSLITYLPEIEPSLMRHLIRGILDGDGNVQGKQTNINNRYKHSVGFCGSNLLMTQIRDWLVENVGVSKNKIYEYSNRCLSMVTWASITNMQLLYHYFYDDSDIYLTRKKDIFDKVMNHYSLK